MSKQKIIRYGGLADADWNYPDLTEISLPWSKAR